MSKLSELKDGSTFYYADILEGEVVYATKIGNSIGSDMHIGEVDVMTESGPDKLLSCTDVYLTETDAKNQTRRYLVNKVTQIKGDIKDLEEQLKYYEDILAKVNNESN